MYLYLIADKNHAINYEVLSGYSISRASAVASRKGEEKRREIEEIISELPVSEIGRVHIVGWEVAQHSKSYTENIEIVLQEFQTNSEFQRYILNIIDENIGERAKDLNLEEKTKLAGYVLDELPSLLCGIEYQNKLYNLHPYPGFSSFDYLLEGLANETLFPKLAKKIHFDGKPAIVEAFIK